MRRGWRQYVLAPIPRQALLLIPILAIAGIPTGIAVDLGAKRRAPLPSVRCKALVLHTAERRECFPRGRLLPVATTSLRRRDNGIAPKHRLGMSDVRFPPNVDVKP